MDEDTWICEYWTESYKVVEVIANKEGKFTLPGVFNPLVDPPRLTIYKRSYVAWNSAEMFPDYSKRSEFRWGVQTYKLEHFNSEYSHETHTSFINSAIRSSIGDKKLIRDAYRWEALEALKEMERMHSKGAL